MPTMVTGARSTGNILQAQRKIDMASRILLLEPNAAPLTVLTKMLNKKACHNPEFSWLEDVSEPRFDAINNGAGYTSGNTALVVDNGAYFRQDFLVKVTRTGEVMRVASVSTNTVTFVRGAGAAALLDNEELLIVGVATPEGDTSRPAVSTQPTKVTNYTQISRDPWEITGTHMHSDQFTEPHDWEYQSGKKGIEHKKSLEYINWMGKPSEDLTDTGKPRRTTGGVFHFLTSNITDAGGAFAEAELWAALRPVYRYSSEQRVAFTSMLAVDVMNSFPRGKLQVQQADNTTTYGLAVFKFVSPHGMLRLITHRLFEGAVYSGYMAILDMGQLKYRYLANEHGSRDSHVRTNIQDRDLDGRKDEWMTEQGLEFGQPLHHGLVTGITS